MIQHASERLREAAREIKPKLRGWLHLVAFPLSLAAGIVLVVLAPTTTTKVAAAIFAAHLDHVVRLVGAVSPRALGAAVARCACAGSTTRRSSC